jgi:hypothetical protein
MAWLFDAATDKVLIPSGWTGTAFTICMWVKRSASASNSHGNNPWRAWSNAAGGGSTIAGIDVQGSSRTTVVAYDSAFTQTVGGDIRSDAGWHPIAVVVNATAWALFYSTANDATSLTKVTATRATGATAGSFTLSDAAPDFFDGAIANVKLFGAALSDAEVAAELATYAQVRSTNLLFRATLSTTSNTPETGTAMTAGSTGITLVSGPSALDPDLGAFAGSAPRATGALAATERIFGAAAGSAPRATGTLAAAIPALGTFVGQTAHPIGVLIGTLAWTGSVGAKSPMAIGTLAAAVRNLGALAGSAPRAVGNLFGGTDFGALAGRAPAAVGKLRTLKHPLAAGAVDGVVAELVPGPAAALDDTAELVAGPAASGVLVLS